MRSEKKIEIQKQRIAELENRIAELEQENSALETEIENNKTTLLSRQELLDEKERHLEETRATFKELIEETRQIQVAYQDAIAAARKLKDEYGRKMAEAIKKTRKHKK